MPCHAMRAEDRRLYGFAECQFSRRFGLVSSLTRRVRGFDNATRLARAHGQPTRHAEYRATALTPLWLHQEGARQVLIRPTICRAGRADYAIYEMMSR